jgi:hypothetical protein
LIDIDHPLFYTQGVVMGIGASKEIFGGELVQSHVQICTLSF